MSMRPRGRPRADADPEERAAREDLVVWLWQHGATLKEMALEFDAPVGTVGCWVSRLRDEGREVPMRYRQRSAA